MRKTFAFNEDRQIKPNYGNREPVEKQESVVVYLEQKIPAELSRAEAVKNIRMRFANRHVKLIDRMGVERWEQIHGQDVKKHRPNEWNQLLADMRAIRKGEWSE